MKIERARSDESDVKRSEANARNVRLQIESNTLTPKTVEGGNQGAFSKVLDAARQTSESSRNEKKTGSAESDAAVDETGEGKKEAGVEAKDIERDDQNGSSGENDGGDSSGWVPTPILTVDMTSETNAAIPQARAILHVADLERIVSTVRSDSFAESKQVTIDLKNSVLDGLRIKLTITEQGNLKAELLALNEQIKKQLDARKNELESVLRDRSIKCHELTVTVLTPSEERVVVGRNSAA